MSLSNAQMTGGDPKERPTPVPVPVPVQRGGPGAKQDNKKAQASFWHGKTYSIMAIPFAVSRGFLAATTDVARALTGQETVRRLACERLVKKKLAGPLTPTQLGLALPRRTDETALYGGIEDGNWKTKDQDELWSSISRSVYM